MTIRLYTYSGFYNGGNANIERQTILNEPYLGRAVVAPGERSDPEASKHPGTKLALLVADTPCTYEITPDGHEPRIADKDSPRLMGEKVVAFGPKWTLSVWSSAVARSEMEQGIIDRMLVNVEAANASG